MGMLVATGQITIVDTNDSLSTGSTPPLNPVANVTLWCDTSVTPNQLKKWNGTKWEIVNEVTVGGRNLIINSNMEATSSGYNICSFYFGNEKPVAGEYMLSFKGELTDAQQTGFYFNVDDNSGSYPGIAGFGINDKGIDGIYRKKVTIPAMQNPITFGFAYATPVGLGKQATMHWMKLEKGNKATDWTPAPEDVQSDINAALAKAAEADYLKAALTGSTDIAGGLVGTNVILLKTLAGLITGGLSGLANDNIGFWTGGTYADAIANLANIILRKDGSGQLAGGGIKWNASGSLLEVVGRILAQSGKIGGLDIFADTLKSNSMSFTENPVETLASLLAPLTSSISNQSSWSNSQTNAEAHAYTQALAVTVDSQIKFKATATPDPALNDRNWLVYLNDSSGNRVFSQSGSGSISNQLFTVNVPAGTYTIHATAGGLMNLGQTYTNSANITGETSSTIIATGYSYQTKIGNNGFYSFWNVLQYLYYSSAQGLKVRGAVDMPAGLGGASISSAGAVIAGSNWGKIDLIGKVVKSGSNFTITHNIGDTNYSIILTPISTNMPYFSSRAANTVVVTCAGGFDFILVRTQ